MLLQHRCIEIIGGSQNLQEAKFRNCMNGTKPSKMLDNCKNHETEKYPGERARPHSHSKKKNELHDIHNKTKPQPNEIFNCVQSK